MRKVEITENSEVCADESEEARLIRNLKEGLQIINNINKNLKEKDIKLTYTVNTVDMKEKIEISDYITVEIKEAYKKVKFNYVP